MNENAFFAIFPFLFAALWVGSTGLIARLSGVQRLAKRYPDRPEQQPLGTMRFQSAQLGKFLMTGFNYGNCLRFDLCPLGLRVRIWRVFAPFSSPFLVPWAEIAIEPKPLLGLSFGFLQRYRLAFGNPALGPLVISGRAARRIAELSNGAFRLPADT